MFHRTLHISAKRFHAKVFAPFADGKALETFLKSPKGKVHDVIPGPTSVVDSKVVRKMLKLSGLDSDISAETEQKWIKALNTQIGFINQLSASNDESHGTESATAEVFRLIASDHQPSKSLGLKELMQQVEENQQMECKEVFEDFDKYIASNVKL
ncbi:hypothetical protein OXX80_012114 [Metschnikowia pulcherrima]